MSELFERIETLLEHQGQTSKLKPEILSRLPKELIRIHKHKIFGNDLLAIPAELLTKGTEEYEKPFSFIDNIEDIDYFENVFRPEISENLFPLGYLYTIKEYVLYDKQTNSVHTFNSDKVLYHDQESLIQLDKIVEIDKALKNKQFLYSFFKVDKDNLSSQLEKPKCSFDEFVKSIGLQTATCFFDPGGDFENVLIEIRNNKIYCDHKFRKVKNDLWTDYLAFCKSQIIDEGMEIYYAPKKVREHLKQFL